MYGTFAAQICIRSLLEAVEIGVGDCCFGRDAAGWVVYKRLLQQVETLVVEVIAKISLRITLPLRE